MLHGFFLWRNTLPEGVHLETDFTCKNPGCKKKFLIECWPYEPSVQTNKETRLVTMHHNTFETLHQIAVSTGEEIFRPLLVLGNELALPQLIQYFDHTIPTVKLITIPHTDILNRKQARIANEKLLLEKFIDIAHTHIKKNLHTISTRYLPFPLFDTFTEGSNKQDSIGVMVFLNTIVVATLFLVFMVIPSLLSGGIEKLLNDRYLFATPVLFILLLTSFQRQIGIIRDKLKFEVLPLGLHEKFIRDSDGSLIHNATIKRFFFGHPGEDVWSRIFQPPLVFGIGAIIIGVVFYHYFWPAHLTLYEDMTPGLNGVIYTSILFNIGYLLFHSPFWFVIGTVVWLSLVTPTFIFTIARNIPLRINPLQDIGGTEILGDVLLKSNVSIVLLACGFIAYVFRNGSILKLDPTFEFFNIFLLSLFACAIVFGFLLPLYPIHKIMKISKDEEVASLTDAIDYDTIKKQNPTLEDINLNLLRLELIKKISMKKEWPFNYDTFVKIVFMTLIPVIELIVNVRPYL